MPVFKDDPNLKGLWLLGEASGTRLDYTPNNNDLTDNNTVGQSAGGGQGGQDCANFELDNSEYLSITDASQAGLGITGNITVCCWVKPESLSTVTQDFITKNDTSIAGGRSYRLAHAVGVAEAGLVGFALSADGSTTAKTALTMGGVITVGSWYHVTGVYNGTDIRVYINGVLSENGGSNPAAYSLGIYDSETAFCLGARMPADKYFDGLMYEAAVFNRALSAAEVLDIYTYGILDPKRSPILRPRMVLPNIQHLQF